MTNDAEGMVILRDRAYGQSRFVCADGSSLYLMGDRKGDETGRWGGTGSLAISAVTKQVLRSIGEAENHSLLR